MLLLISKFETRSNQIFCPEAASHLAAFVAHDIKDMMKWKHVHI